MTTQLFPNLPSLHSIRRLHMSTVLYWTGTARLYSNCLLSSLESKTKEEEAQASACYYYSVVRGKRSARRLYAMPRLAEATFTAAKQQKGEGRQEGKLAPSEFW